MINKNLLLIILSVLCTSSFGQNGVNIQNTAVPFLLITPDAKSSGMGNASIGVSPAVNDLFMNSAKIANLNERSGFTLNYTPWLKDIGIEDVYLLTTGYYKKINQISAFHVALKYFTLGEFDFTNEKGIPTQPSQKSGEYSIEAGYSLKINDKFSIGSSLKYIRSKLFQGNYNGSQYNAASAIAGDIGLYYHQKENSEGFNAGALLSNLGSKINYLNNNDNSKNYFLPAKIAIGVGYLKNLDNRNSLEFGLDFDKLMVPTLSYNANKAQIDEYYDQTVVDSWINSFQGNRSTNIGSSYNISSGVEYNYDKLFYLRAGYHYEENINSSNMNYITLGTSIKYNNMKFNASYIPPTSAGVSRNPLSNTFSLGTTIHFN